MTADELVEAYGVALREQAAAQAMLAGCEGTLEVIVSELLEKAEGSEWKAKAAAKASSSYKSHLHDVMEARERAEKAKAECEYLRVRFEKWRTSMSFKKAAMQNG